MFNNISKIANIFLLFLVVFIFTSYLKKPDFRISFMLQENKNSLQKDTFDNFSASGTFLIREKNYIHDANQIQLSTIECDFKERTCIESMIINNGVNLQNFLYKYIIIEINERGFRAKSTINNSELIYTRTLKTLIKNYQLDGKIFPLKLE